MQTYKHKATRPLIPSKGGEQFSLFPLTDAPPHLRVHDFL